MIAVNKAILHVFDTTNMQAVLSDVILELDDELISFLEGHIGKCFHKASSKPGSFLETSIFNKHVQDYVENGNFVVFSKSVANIWFDIIRQANGIMTSDLFVCDILYEDIRYLVFLRLCNQRAYVPQTTMEEGTVRNVIQAQASIPTGTTEEFAAIRVDNGTLLISQKKYDIDGNSIYALSEAVMECMLKSSQQEAVNAIKKTAVKIAEDFGVNTVQTAASVKNAIAKELEDKETLNPIQLGTAIFSKAPTMQEAFQQKMQDSGFAKDERITVNKETLLKKVINHKLKTDTGIELTIPAEYFDNTEFIEFNHAEDGSLFITIKNISRIINRG